MKYDLLRQLIREVRKQASQKSNLKAETEKVLKAYADRFGYEYRQQTDILAGGVVSHGRWGSWRITIQPDGSLLAWVFDDQPPHPVTPKELWGFIESGYDLVKEPDEIIDAKNDPRDDDESLDDDEDWEDEQIDAEDLDNLSKLVGDRKPELDPQPTKKSKAN